MTHTPGPWYINGGRIEGQRHYTSQAKVVAQVGTVNDQSPEDTANARLIAAAPELLMALEDLITACDTVTLAGKAYTRTNFRALVAASHAAIAKAKGV